MERENVRYLISRERLVRFGSNFVIARRRFLRKKILGKFTGNVGNLDVKNTTVSQQHILVAIG